MTNNLKNNLPWVEKYRPSNLSDICSHTSIVSTLKNLISCDRLPHLLFYGPPGSGKTSVIICCANILYGEYSNAYLIHLNASDERGIDVVRQRIKDFCNASILFHPPKIKLVILDEADSMTDDAQLALREIVVKNTEKVRFCLICNYVSKIIPQLKSRFSSFRFTPLKEEAIIGRIKMISLQENIEYDDYSLRLINKISKGDFRKYINIFQSVYLQSKKITKSSIHQCIGYPSNEVTDKIINSLLYTKSLSENYQLIIDYLDDDYHFEYIIDAIVHNVLNHQLSNSFMIKIIKKLSEIQLNINVNTKLQISNLIMCFLNINND